MRGATKMSTFAQGSDEEPVEDELVEPGEPKGMPESPAERDYLDSVADAGLDAWGAEFDLGHLAAVREHNFKAALAANDELRARRAAQRRRRAAIVRSAKRCPGCHRMAWPFSRFAHASSVFAGTESAEHIEGCPHDPAPQSRISEAAGG